MAATQPTIGKESIELILGQLDALPSLDAVAVRLLELTTASDSDARDIVEVISSDPALAGRVLSLCRCSERGRAANVTTLDRAVVLLGFDTVRSATLAVQVFGSLDSVPAIGGERPNEEPFFDRTMYWRHSLATAVLAEWLAGATRGRVAPGEAFLAGLLHDIGHLVLHVLLPRTFDRVCELAESRGLPIDRAARTVMEFDTRVAGKRLAERWGLPEALVDAVWLNGLPVDGLPDRPHRELVALVTVADAVVRRQHIAGPGHGPRGEPITALAAGIDVDAPTLDALVPRLHDEVSERATALGIDSVPGDGILLRAIGRANELLERRHRSVTGRLARAERQAKVFDAVNEFWDACADERTLDDVLAGVAASADRVFDGGFLGLLCKHGRDRPWRLLETDEGRPEWVEFGPVASLDDIWLADDQPVPAALRDRLSVLAGAETPRLLPIHQEPGAKVVVLYLPRADNGTAGIVRPLRRSWSAAIGAAVRWETMRNLTEELAMANRDLADARDDAARARAMASVGEIAAGAAHELNNPLAVIAGRSQLLVDRVRDPETRSTVQLIARQALQLSDLVTGLRHFADPTPPHIESVPLEALADAAIVAASERLGAPIEVVIDVDPDARAACDAAQIESVLCELICNAREADPRCEIVVSVQADPSDDRLRVEVTDSGSGLSEHALAHAFDPFFSEKPAGRRPGLGLALARRVVETQGGTLSLRNGRDHGAVATMWLPAAEVVGANDDDRGEGIADGTQHRGPHRGPARRSA